MPLYQHRFRGTTAVGDIFVFSWWADDSRATGAANTAAAAWVTTLMQGVSAGNGLQDHLNTAVSIDMASTGLIDPATGLQSELVETPTTLPGLAAANPLPSDVALVVSLRTALANRRGRGRFYLPQLVVTDVTAEARVSADAVTDITSSLSLAWTGYNSATARPVVYSRTGRSTQDITSFDIGNLFDTQRRRENSAVEARQAAPMP